MQAFIVPKRNGYKTEGGGHAAAARAPKQASAAALWHRGAAVLANLGAISAGEPSAKKSGVLLGGTSISGWHRPARKQPVIYYRLRLR